MYALANDMQASDINLVVSVGEYPTGQTNKTKRNQQVPEDLA